jgi:hypothetical protein
LSSSATHPHAPYGQLEGLVRGKPYLQLLSSHSPRPAQAAAAARPPTYPHYEDRHSRVKQPCKAKAGEGGWVEAEEEKGAGLRSKRDLSLSDDGYHIYRLRPKAKTTRWPHLTPAKHLRLVLGPISSASLVFVFDKEKVRMERVVLSWLMRTVEVKLEELQELAKKEVFFMGDAVHAEPIIGGEGANAAIRDGVSLAECISTNGTEGIPAWYDAQYSGWEASIRKSEKAIAEIHGDPKSSLL